MRRFLAVVRGLIALITLAALMVGVPWLLVTTVGNPYPAEGLTLSGRLTDNALIGVIAVVAWVVWAQLVLLSSWRWSPRSGSPSGSPGRG